jgi:myo-inositol catabolism protein IolS
MQYRKLGKTGLKVSVIGVGTWQFGGEWGRDYTAEDAAAVLDAAKAQGINLIDTAECYGDHLSEKLIGEWLARQTRDDWVVATKFGHRFTGHLKRDDDYTADGMEEQLNASLEALKTDYVDLLQFHSGGDDVFFNDELWARCRQVRESGRVRHLGLSVGKNTNLKQVEAAKEYGFETVQIIYNRLSREPEEEVFPAIRRMDLGVLGRVPLASGFLTGKYEPGANFPENDVRAKRSQEMIDEQLEEVQRIKDEEVPGDVPMARWALAWCLKHEAVSCVIPGCKSAEQARENARAAELEIVRPDHPLATPKP